MGNLAMIVYCCSDLIFSTKIRSTAEHLGVPSRPVRDAQMLRDRLEQVDDGKTSDPISGVLIDLDTGETGLALIEQAKAFDPSLPVIAFGSHVATAVLETARGRGADAVMPRSQFTAQLPAILRAYAGPSV